MHKSSSTWVHGDNWINYKTHQPHEMQTVYSFSVPRELKSTVAIVYTRVCAVAKTYRYLLHFEVFCLESALSKANSIPCSPLLTYRRLWLIRTSRRLVARLESCFVFFLLCILEKASPKLWMCTSIVWHLFSHFRDGYHRHYIWRIAQMQKSCWLSFQSLLSCCQALAR